MKMRHKHRSPKLVPTMLRALALLSFGGACLSRPAYADVTAKDFEVMVRSIGFLQAPPSGNQIFAIVYNPANTDSAREAHQLQDDIGSGVSANGMTLQARLVPVSNLEMLRGARFAFVTQGLQGDYRRIATAAHADQILSFSRDRACVEQKCCLVYVGTEGRVEIVVNQEAAEASKVEFKPVFLMTVTVL